MLVDSGDGWVEVVTSQKQRGLVPKNFLNFIEQSELAEASTPDVESAVTTADESAPAVVEYVAIGKASAVADFEATEGYMARYGRQLFLKGKLFASTKLLRTS